MRSYVRTAVSARQLVGLDRTGQAEVPEFKDETAGEAGILEKKDVLGLYIAVHDFGSMAVIEAAAELCKPYHRMSPTLAVLCVVRRRSDSPD